MWSKMRVDSKKNFLESAPPPPLCQGLDDGPPRHLKVWIRHCTVSKKRQTSFWDSCMIVFRYATVIKLIAMIFALKKMKGLSQPLKDLALTDQTDFSRFLWSASLVSRVEVWWGLSDTHHHLKWRNQGRSGASIIFRPNWGPKGRKKFFWERPPFILGSGWPPPSLI